VSHSANTVRRRWSSVRSQVAVGFAVLVALLAIVGSMLLAWQQHQLATMDRMLDADVRIDELSMNSRIAFLEARRSETDYVRLRAESGLGEATSRAAAQVRAATGRIRRDMAEIRALTNDADAIRETQAAVEQAAARYEAGFPRSESESYRAAANTIEPALAKLHGYAVERVKATRANVGQDAKATEWVVFAAGLLAVSLGLFVAFLVSRHIARPVNKAVMFVNRVAQGDLNIRLPDGCQGEFDALAEALNSMAAALQDTSRTQEQREGALRAAEAQLSGILESIDNVVWAMSATDYELLYINPAAERIYGRRAAEFFENQQLWSERIHPRDRNQVFQLLPELFAKGALTLEYRILRPDGDVRWVEDRARVAFDEEGKPVRLYGVASDINMRKRQEARIEYLANHDALSGLPNRNLLEDRIAQAVAQVRRTGQRLALICLDLDRFKFINDSFGHAIGDSLLKMFAMRLCDVVQGGDTVARLAGDEFVIMLPALADADDVTHVAHKVLATFAEPFVIDEHVLHVTASVGMSVCPEDGDDSDTLLKKANAAMYRAKTEGGDSLQFYTQEMGAQARERVELEAALRRALDQQEFELYYEPQVDLRTGQISGVEALIRWRHPELGFLSPARFIPLAEETGLIGPIGEWVLQSACTQAARWHAAGYSNLSLAVNLSARQFQQHDISELVRRILLDTGLEAEWLKLELTESMVMHDSDAALLALRQLKAIGVGLSLDDFGTGYSSLSYLKRFPIDVIKIDRAFIRELTTNADDASITKAIIATAQSLNMKTIAEGVETEAQVAALIATQCDAMQGHFFSRPLPVRDVEALLERGEGLPAHLLQRQKHLRTLLLVDDEEYILMALTRLLRRKGYRILTASSGQQGLELLAKNDVDVIVSDQRMPTMTGVDFLRRAKDMYPDTVRIVLSGQTELKSTALRTGTEPASK